MPEEALQKCILIGFSDRVGRRLDSGTLRCQLVHGRSGVLTRESAVQHSPLLVVAEIREIEGKDKSVQTLLSLATAVEEKWLRELFPEDMAGEPRVFYDAGHTPGLRRGTGRFPGSAIELTPGGAAARRTRRPGCWRRK